MRALLAIAATAAALGAAFVPTAPTAPGSNHCGGSNRWDVKTLSDKRAKKVRDAVERTTIDHLTLELHDPRPGTKTERDHDGSGVELTVFRVVGVGLVEARIEKDSDIHLVLG